MATSARGRWMATVIADAFKIGEYDTQGAFAGSYT